jgi:arabinogalactan endo-1,4-beta-galactosidase
MIHLDRGGDNKTASWWFDNALKNGLKFDCIGLSYYPLWHGTLAAMESNVNALAKRYGKDIYIVETGYPWVIDAKTMATEHVEGDSKGLLPGYPASPEGQAKFLAQVLDIIQKIPDGKGKGLLYWAPTWISTAKKPSPYDNLALINYSGEALPAVQTLGGSGKQNKEK